MSILQILQGNDAATSKPDETGFIAAQDRPDTKAHDQVKRVPRQT